MCPCGALGSPPTKLPSPYFHLSYSVYSTNTHLTNEHIYTDTKCTPSPESFAPLFPRWSLTWNQLDREAFSIFQLSVFWNPRSLPFSPKGIPNTSLSPSPFLIYIFPARARTLGGKHPTTGIFCDLGPCRIPLLCLHSHKWIRLCAEQ